MGKLPGRAIALVGVAMVLDNALSLFVARSAWTVFWLAVGFAVIAAGVFDSSRRSGGARAPAGGRLADKLVGWLLWGLAAPMLLLVLVLGGYAIDCFEKGSIGTGIVCAAIWVFSLAALFMFPRRARQYLAKSAAEVEASEEEVTAAVLADFGPVVAIGKPGEELPTLGAARLYVEDERWQEVVASYMDRATLVVLRLGKTMGFWWELERSAAKLDPTRLVLLSPYDREAYEEFRRQAGPRFPRPLPEFVETDLYGALVEGGSSGSVRGLIRFNTDWTSEYVDLASASWQKWSWLQELRWTLRSPFYKKLKWTLRPVYSQRAVAWP